MNFIPVLMTAMSKSDVANATDFWTAQFSSFTPATVLLTLAFALITGVLISLVYKITYRGVLYSPQFSMVLIMLTLVTAPVVMAIGSNVALSMGMVGALSIVRFRTAIKEPLDIAFLFWSIAVGIVLGAGLIPLAVFGSIVIGGMLLLFAKRRGADAPYLLVLRCRNEAAEQAAAAALAGQVKRSAVKSKTVTDAGIELTLEVALSSAATSFVNALNSIEGVESASLVSYNGDYTA